MYKKLRSHLLQRPIDRPTSGHCLQKNRKILLIFFLSCVVLLLERKIIKIAWLSYTIFFPEEEEEKTTSLVNNTAINSPRQNKRKKLKILMSFLPHK